MGNKKIEMIDEFLNKKVNQNGFTLGNKALMNSNKRKKILTSTVAIVIAGVTAITSFIATKTKKVSATDATTSVVETTEHDISNVSINDIGVKLEFNEAEKKQYGKTTGNVNKEEIVEKNGTIWKDQEAADKSDEVGKTKIDDKNGTLKVKSDGKVYEKEKGYEVVDEKGKVVDSGSNKTGFPEDKYVHDKNLDKDVVKEDANKFVYADSNYYDMNGKLVFKKGEIVLKETLEKAKKELYTTKPTKVETTTKKEESTTNKVETTQKEEPTTKKEEPTTKKEETTTIQNIEQTEGVVNANGTYTIYGETYKSKADFEQFLLHPEQYGYYNGMVLSLEDIEQLSKSNQKTLN